MSIYRKLFPKGMVSARGVLLVILVIGSVSAYSATVGTGVPVVDNTVDSTVGATNSAFGDQSSANLDGSLNRVELDANEIVVTIEKTNFGFLKVITPDGQSMRISVVYVEEETFTFDDRLPSGTYTVQTMKVSGTGEPDVINSYEVELSQ